MLPSTKRPTAHAAAIGHRESQALAQVLGALGCVRTCRAASFLCAAGTRFACNPQDTAQRQWQGSRAVKCSSTRKLCVRECFCAQAHRHRRSGEHGRRGDARGAGLLDIAFCERLVLAKLLAGDPPDVGLQRGGRLGTSNLQAVEVQAQHLMSGHACTTARTQCHRACTPACMRTGHRAHRPAGTLTVSREDAIVCMFFKKKTLQQFGHSVGV